MTDNINNGERKNIFDITNEMLNGRLGANNAGTKSSVKIIYDFDDLWELRKTSRTHEVKLEEDGNFYDLLSEIENELTPMCVVEFNLKYDSMRMLLNQAIENDFDFTRSIHRKARFIICDLDSDARERVLKDEGYTKPDICSNIIDPHLYRYVYQSLIRNNKEAMEIVNRERKKVLYSFINNDDIWTDEEELCKYYTYPYYLDDFSSYDSIMPTGDTLFALDILADYFFEDYYQNVFYDITQIIKYVGLTQTSLVPQERINFYQLVLNLKDADLNTIRNFFNNYKNSNFVEIFSNDKKILRSHSHNLLVSSCTKFTNDLPLYNQELSSKYGCDVYYLNGEDFNAIARSSRIKKSKYPVSPDGEDIPGLTKEMVEEVGYSFTYWNKNDIQTYSSPSEYVTLLYKDLKAECIGHVYKNDSDSSPEYDRISDKVNELHTPNSITEESTKYPEIVYNHKNKEDEPLAFALVCYDKITPWDVAFAKKFGYSIVLANTLKYERKHEQERATENIYLI